MTKSFQLKETLKGLSPFFKSAQPVIKEAVIQSLIIYGAVMLLVLAALGPDYEIVRVGASVMTEFFLEASILIFFTRRLIMKETLKSEWLDLHLKLPELKVMGVQFLTFLLMPVIAISTRLIGYFYEKNIDKVINYKMVLLPLTIIGMVSLIIGVVFILLRLYLVSVFIGDNHKGAFKGSWYKTKGILLRLMWVPFVVMIPWFILSRIEGNFIAPLMEAPTLGSYIARSLSDIIVQLCKIIPSCLSQVYLYLILVKGVSPALSETPKNISSGEEG